MDDPTGDSGEDAVVDVRNGDRAPAAGELSTAIRAQDADAEAVALAFIGTLLRLRGVRVEREHFSPRSYGGEA